MAKSLQAAKRFALLKNNKDSRNKRKCVANYVPKKLNNRERPRGLKHQS